MSPVSHPAGLRATDALAALVVATLLASSVSGAGLSARAYAIEGAAAPDHLVVSELVTGGASASDEFVEIYNPTGAALPLEGLELVYASASGLTVSRRAIWEAGAPQLPAGRHLLIANELGIYAGIADATYPTGMAATGGSVALRIVGAASAIDAVGWGSAAGSWMEGLAAPAPSAGASLERLPGGSSGSTQDTDDNATDFALRTLPSPENLGSPPVPGAGSTASPVASASASPDPTVAPTLAPTPSIGPTPSPGVSVVPIATARALADGTVATIEGVALTGAGFTDGGGYVADASGSVAVLLTGGSFERGELVRVTGELDDRYAQRTLRVAAANLLRLGWGAEPAPAAAATGSIDEALEGRLVRVAGKIAGAPTLLSAGPAFDVDDGSGPVRVLVATATGIDVTAWSAGVVIDVVGVVGQRDATGTGSAGYRVQPRDAADVRSVGTPPSSSPIPSTQPSQSAGPSPSGAPGGDVISIAAARQLPKNSRVRVRGVVTLVPGVVDPTSAVIQDATGAILLRAGDEFGPFVRGTLVEIEGTRSTLGGMETLRVTAVPRSLGLSSEPAPRALRTGDAGETQEAALVTVRGGLVGAPRRSTSGSVSFEIDDGSGPVRVVIGAATGIDASGLSAGTWIEVRGPLGQDTTGSQPLRGYRVWPRDASDLRVTAPAGGAAGVPAGAVGGSGAPEGPLSTASLEAVGSEVDPDLPVGATLVTGPWAEMGIGGLLWDGVRLLALDERLGGTVSALSGQGTSPTPVEILGLHTVGVEPVTGIAVADVRDDAIGFTLGHQPPTPPATVLPTAAGGAQWVSLVGEIARGGDHLMANGAAISIDRRCAAQSGRPHGVVSVTGIAIPEPPLLIVPCGGIAPAPVLGRDAPGALARAAGSSPGGPSAGFDSARPESGGLAALLLSTVAAAFVVGAIGLRRMNPGPGSSDPADDGSPTEDDDAPDRGSVPALTLVAVPRERAP